MSEYGESKIITKNIMRLILVLLPLFLATACASVDIPNGTTTSVSAIKPPADRFEGLNEKQDPVTRVHLGRDVLMPQPLREDPLPEANVGPFELRGETLASALQLILDEYDVSLAFESDEALKRRITVSNLHGKLKDVIHRVCTLADLYCHFEEGTLTVKRTETFVVDLPPISDVAAPASSSSGGGSSSGSSSSSTSSSSSSSSSGSSSGSTTNDAYTQIAQGLTAVLKMGDPRAGENEKPIIDTSTRVLIYAATQRSNKYAAQYFERLRKDTALIIFETHIWEVTLDNDNQTGINWSSLAAKVGNFNLTSGAFTGALPAGVGSASPITITPSYTGGKNFSANFILNFISEHGSVKTISQPQITVLSGSKASLAVAQQDNYVSGQTSTLQTLSTPGQTTLTTGTVTTGLVVNVTSAWDQSTVYGAINITLNDLIRIDTFNSKDGTSTVQLPHTTSRSLATEIRVRPGDAILIGGLVSQTDSLTASGPGLLTPLFTTDRTANKVNTELVFLLRPRVVAFVMGDDSDTPRIADAPKDGILSPEPVANKTAESLNNTSMRVSPVSGSANKATIDKRAALPAGLSPEAFAPQNTPAPAVPEDIPASLQEQALPVPLSVRPAVDQGGGKKSGTDNGGSNQ